MRTMWNVSQYASVAKNKVEMLTSLARLETLNFFLILGNKFLEFRESRVVISNTCCSMPVVINRISAPMLCINK